MLRLQRPPKDREELWWLIKALFGIELPRQSVCEGHTSPFEAVAHAYFGEEPNFAVWYASRGSGKSLALAVLGLIKSMVLDVDVTILGGSMTQSLNVRAHMAKLMSHKNAPSYAVKKSTATVVQLHTGREIKPLPASQTTVRGPHPPLQLLDEVDEMDKAIYDASLGQAMEQENIHHDTIDEYIVASSTWQNPEGTFTSVIESARDRGQPVFTWCWRELLAENGGWMSRRFIENKRNTVSAQMWATEYDLNEPSASGRAFDLDKVAAYFIHYPATVGEKHEGNGDYDVWTWEEPDVRGRYAVGADWAKEKDKTVIAVLRYDCHPRKLVKLIRINRRPWDYMIGLYNTEQKRYHATGSHDGTGVGNVVNDFLTNEDQSSKFVMIGRPRTQLLLDYITSFEHGNYRLPHLVDRETGEKTSVMEDVLYRAHRAVTVADVYAPGKWNTHLPDEIAAMALAHRAAEMMPGPVTSLPDLSKLEHPRAADSAFHVKPFADATASAGEVTVVDSRYGFDQDMQLWVPSGGGRDEWEASAL